MSWRVDTLPLPLRPLLYAFGVVAAAGLALVWGLLKLTVRVRNVGEVPADQNAATIECAWHEALLPYFIARMPYPRPYVWMNHPALYMKGIHVFLGWMGVGELVLGSSGHGGRAALAALGPKVQAGQSTFLNPDGPHGPAHVVRDGVLDLSIATGAPVLALRLTCSGAIRIPTWDRKVIPLPFSRIDVHHAPLRVVTAADREAARAAIASDLGLP
ncbi:MAG: DUF374 domain-containing protein [Deltaproteobacteria bacterium]|nr:DUF374 domain-containing protein [Deltaproteobacteria bacterium]